MTFLDTLQSAGFAHAMIQVTGESDTGKTKFALQTGAHPSQTCFLDADVKGRVTVQQIISAGLQFGYYRDVVEETKEMRELEYHQYCLDRIADMEKLLEKRRRVIVWDTWEPFEKTFQPVVASDPKRFRQFYSPNGAIKGAEQWLSSFDYEAEIITRIVAMCQLFIAVNHVKPYSIQGKRIEGKVVADCKKPVVQKALMRIWTRHNPDSAVPIGLVMKRMGKDAWVEGVGIRTVNVLPRKLTPQPQDQSLWDVIRRYWENPIGNRKPEPHETPNAFELSILDGTLTEDQRLILRAAITAEAEVVADEMAAESESQTRAQAMKDDGKGYAEIAKELGVPVPAVMKLLK